MNKRNYEIFPFKKVCRTEKNLDQSQAIEAANMP